MGNNSEKQSLNDSASLYDNRDSQVTTFMVIENLESNDGPDQILPATDYTTTDVHGVVRLRVDEGAIPKPPPESVPGLLARTALLKPSHAALAYKKHEDEVGFHYISYLEYYQLVRTVAKAFLKLGLERYHSVAIMGFNSPEWIISYLAAIHAGGLATGIYSTNTPEACSYCLSSCRANIVVVEDEIQLEKILKCKDELPLIKVVVQYKGVPNMENVLSWDELLALGSLEDDALLESTLRKIAINQACSLIFTSGTVGNPKTAMITHDNFIAIAKGIIKVLKIQLNETTVSYLPLSHVAAQIVDIFTSIICISTLHFANPNALKGGLIDTLLEVRPTRFIGVPRVWEKMEEKMKNAGAEVGPFKKMIAKWAKVQGLKHYMDSMKGTTQKTFSYYLANALVFKKVKKKLGFDKCKTFISGAAPLADEIKLFFASLDIPIHETFGMTECSGPHTFCTDEHYRISSCGKAMPGTKTKLTKIDMEEYGEICINGRHIFMGYLNDPEKTQEAFDNEGWLRTGDFGTIDDEGFLYITGRIKELLITAGGENIPPLIIENNVKLELPCLGQAVLIGERKKFLSILLTFSCDADPETGEPLDELTGLSKRWLESVGCPYTTMREVIESGPDECIIAAIQKGIDAANAKATSRAQRVQKFAILPSDFSVPTGELGPTLKLRRNVVHAKYKEVIDKFYD